MGQPSTTGVFFMIFQQTKSVWWPDGSWNARGSLRASRWIPRATEPHLVKDAKWGVTWCGGTGDVKHSNTEGFEYQESHPLNTLYHTILLISVNYELHWITFKFLLNASHHPPSMIQIHIGPSNGVFKIMGRGWTGIPGWVSESPGGRAVGHQVFERGAGHPGHRQHWNLYRIGKVTELLGGFQFHRIGWWENLQERPIFDGKNHGFL